MPLPYYYAKRSPRGSVVVFATAIGDRIVSDEMPEERAEWLAHCLNMDHITEQQMEHAA
jgi:hypothetical protein